LRYKELESGYNKTVGREIDCKITSLFPGNQVLYTPTPFIPAIQIPPLSHSITGAQGIELRKYLTYGENTNMQPDQMTGQTDSALAITGP